MYVNNQLLSKNFPIRNVKPIQLKNWHLFVYYLCIFYTTLIHQRFPLLRSLAAAKKVDLYVTSFSK